MGEGSLPMPHSPKIVARRSPGGMNHVPRGEAGQRGLTLVDQVVAHYSASLQDVFGHFDADGDGSLFFTEFVGGMQPLGATTEEIQALWDAIDVDRQGSVPFDNFNRALHVLTKRAKEVKWISPFNRVKTNRVIDALIAARNTPEEVFQVIDVNRNGWISKLEWKSKLPELGISPQAYNQRELDAAWRSLDQNGDGRVNWSEWIKAFRIITGSPTKRGQGSPAESPGSPTTKVVKELSDMSRAELEQECASHRKTLQKSAVRLDNARKQVAELKAENARLQLQIQGK